MKKLLILLAAFLLLTACSESETSSDPDVSKKDVVEEINEEADSDADAEPVVEEPVDKATVYNDYGEQIFLSLQSIIADIQTIQMLCELGAKDPVLLLTEGYADVVQATADDLHENIAKIRATKVNDPELQEIHDHLLQSMDDLEFIANNFPVGVKEINADLIFQCTDALNRGTEHVKNANELLTNYKNKYGL
jgi:uncharacterized protein YcfL